MGVPQGCINPNHENGAGEACVKASCIKKKVQKGFWIKKGCHSRICTYEVRVDLHSRINTRIKGYGVKGLAGDHFYATWNDIQRGAGVLA